MTAAEYVYVASSWRNPDQPALIDAIRAQGIGVYDFRHPAPGDEGFAWSEIDPAWKDWTPEQYVGALEHPRAVEGYAKDFAAMQAADTFVLLLPCGRSAHLELGWAVGAGKRTAIVLNGAHEPELMVKMVDHIAIDVPDVLAWLTPPALTVPTCGLCRRERTLHDAYDYNPLQAITGQPLGWYSGDDGEICPQCMTKTMRGEL